MTPKEKANEIYDLFFDADIPDITKAHHIAKKYALVAVNEIIDSYRAIYDDYICDTDRYRGYSCMKPYWQEVKQELEKL